MLELSHTNGTRHAGHGWQRMISQNAHLINTFINAFRQWHPAWLLPFCNDIPTYGVCSQFPHAQCHKALYHAGIQNQSTISPLYRVYRSPFPRMVLILTWRSGKCCEHSEWQNSKKCQKTSWEKTRAETLRQSFQILLHLNIGTQINHKSSFSKLKFREGQASWFVKFFCMRQFAQTH